MQTIPVPVAEMTAEMTSSPQPVQLEPRSVIHVSNLLPADAQPPLALLPARPSLVTPYVASSSTYSCRGETEDAWAKRIVYMSDGSQCVALEEEVLGPKPTG